MNKLVKGSIAGAAGIALLLGGAGTLALWNDAEDVDAGTVQTGTLDIALIDADGVASPATGIWEDVSPELAAATPFDPSTHKIVPGDVVTFTQDVTIEATGKNLEAQLSYDAGSIEIDPALLGIDPDPSVTTDDWVTVDFDVTAIDVADAPTISPLSPGVYTVTPAADGTTAYRVVITVTFNSATPGQIGQDEAAGVDLTAASFTITQVRPS